MLQSAEGLLLLSLRHSRAQHEVLQELLPCFLLQPRLLCCGLAIAQGMVHVRPASSSSGQGCRDNQTILLNACLLHGSVAGASCAAWSAHELRLKHIAAFAQVSMTQSSVHVSAAHLLV